MLYLSAAERKEWADYGREISRRGLAPAAFDAAVRPNLRPMFMFYAGALLGAMGRTDLAQRWFHAGAEIESDRLFSNLFMVGFLERQQGRFAMPAVAFEDPRPFVHFAGVPLVRAARQQFLGTATDSLPVFRQPVRLADIGCGNGALAVQLLQHLQAAGKLDAVGEILLVDPSPAMLDLAHETVAAAFPEQVIRRLCHRIEDVSAAITERYDVALMSLAYHHMPWEKKRAHLRRLRDRLDHVLVFELHGDHDTPERGSPELAVSVYQSYGRIIDAVFRHDAPVAVAQSCVDRFLLTEVISLLTQPRGTRTDYHMTRGQWHALLAEALGAGFGCQCDATAYADEHLDLFTLHYARASA